jgi:non-ribosomal peptide synthetase component F
LHAALNDLSSPWSNATQERFRRLDDWLERPLIDRFQQVAARHGRKLAVDDGVTRLTYSELRSAVFRLARHIVAAVPIGRPVGILLPNGARFPIAALACLAVGRPYVPVDPTYPAERNGQLVREAGLSAVIVDGAEPDIPCVPPSLPHLSIADSLAQAGGTEAAIASGTGPAFMLYTSGSSGRPKGI